MGTAREAARDAVVGQAIGVSARYEYSEPCVGVVTRITKTLIIVTTGKGVSEERFRFSREDGYQHGEKYRRVRLMSVADVAQEVARMREAKALERKRQTLRNANWGRINDELADKVLALITGMI